MRVQFLRIKENMSSRNASKGILWPDSTNKDLFHTACTVASYSQKFPELPDRELL